MFGMFNQQRTTATMLVDIKKACGIFLSEAQYDQVIRLPEPNIAILWQHKDKVKTMVFHHNDLFEQLLQLRSDNLDMFFKTAKIGPCGNAQETMNILHIRQQAAPAVTVIYTQAPPPVSYNTPYPANLPVYQYPQAASVNPMYASYPVGNPNIPMQQYPSAPPYASPPAAYTYSSAPSTNPSFFPQQPHSHHHTGLGWNNSFNHNHP
jgi:hypothetical protein